MTRHLVAHQILEVAGIVAGACAAHGRAVSIAGYNRPPEIVRNYRVSGEKIEKAIGFLADDSIFVTASDIFERLSKWSTEEILAPQYYNIRWMKLLEGIYADQKGFDRIGV